MEKFVLDPRRSPRIPARCHVGLAARGAGTWRAATEDVGPRGCQIVSPWPLDAGGEVRLSTAGPELSPPLTILGRVAWATRSPPLRAGIAFAEAQAGGGPGGWFERLVQASPALAQALGRLPDRLSFDTVLYLGPPPQYIIDFTAEELAVLELVGDGLSVGDLQARLAASWERSGRAIFLLLSRRAVTPLRDQGVPGRLWTEVLAAARASPAEAGPLSA